ncbi:hypothetical protein VCHA43P277_60237 [Vibrio chagasii]|nr:hypothetical protein VCHA43P277_60237 [Vibrio chagasii]
MHRALQVVNKNTIHLTRQGELCLLIFLFNCLDTRVLSDLYIDCHDYDPFIRSYFFSLCK